MSSALCRSFLALFALVALFVLPTAAGAGLSESYGRLPLHFEENRGQADREVQFLARGPGYGLYLTASEAVLVLGAKDRTVLRMALVGANSDSPVSGLDELPGKANYFIGKDSSKWRTNVPTYAKVRYREVYPGIDLVYYGNQRQLEYDFVVAPGADPTEIVLRFEGADAIKIDTHGDLVLHTANGELRQHKPVIYQETDGVRQLIEGSYVIKDAHQVAFQFAAYDESRPLIIDPMLFYSTYLGGNSDDYAWSIAVDGAGHAYVTGSTGSTNFPTTDGSSQTTFGACHTAFVAKFDRAGSALVYSTYLGGLDSAGCYDNVGSAIVVDDAGHAYVTGYTFADFPTTAEAFQRAHIEGDAFVTKLSPTGDGLVYSTLLGGGFDDFGTGIALDASGSAYVAGWTYSPDFPTTAGAFQPTYGGGGTAGFVAKLNPAGSAVEYSTYLHGGDASGHDYIRGIAVDARGSTYVAGATNPYSNHPPNFPTTPGAFQITYGGGSVDAFVAKLNSTGSALVYSTYLGGSGWDDILGIAIDAAGHAYVAGRTISSDFPTTAAALQPNHGGGTWDAFVTKLNVAGSALLYSTYLGGIDHDFGTAIAVDADGRAYVTGATRSSNFPTTPGPFQANLRNMADAFVTKFELDGTTLAFSSYLGGDRGEGGTSIALDAAGNVLVAGYTASADFPTTSGAFQRSHGGGGNDVFGQPLTDAFVAMFVPSTRSEESAASFTGYWPTYGPETGTFSGGAIRASNQATATAAFSFTGTAVSWIGVKCNVCGLATVQIDGGAPTVVDTFGPGEPGTLTSGPVFTASGLAPDTTHTLTIVVTGGGAAVPGFLTGSAHVAADAFDVTR